jgi:hypothetical protein
MELATDTSAQELRRLSEDKYLQEILSHHNEGASGAVYEIAMELGLRRFTHIVKHRLLQPPSDPRYIEPHTLALITHNVLDYHLDNIRHIDL